MNVTVQCQTLYSLCQVCQRYIRISLRLFWPPELPKLSSKAVVFLFFFCFCFFATKPAPIKQHTRAEKRKFKELWGNLLRVSVRLRHQFPLGAADRIVSEIRSRHCPPVAFFVLSHPPAGFSVPPTLNPSSVFWSTRIICLCVWKLFCLFTANQTVKCTG